MSFCQNRCQDRLARKTQQQGKRARRMHDEELYINMEACLSDCHGFGRILESKSGGGARSISADCVQGKLDDHHSPKVSLTDVGLIEVRLRATD